MSRDNPRLGHQTNHDERRVVKFNIAASLQSILLRISAFDRAQESKNARRGDGLLRLPWGSMRTFFADLLDSAYRAKVVWLRDRAYRSRSPDVGAQPHLTERASYFPA